MGHGYGPHGRLLFGVPRKYDPNHMRIHILHPFQQLSAVHLGHAQVGDDDVHRLTSQDLHRCLAARGEQHLPPVALPV